MGRIGLIVTMALCILALYIISIIPKYPFEGFLSGSAGDVGSPGVGIWEVPTSIKCKKANLNASSAVSTTQSGGATWLCDDSVNAKKLMSGQKVSDNVVPYLARNDLVCIKQDEKGTIYTCIDPAVSNSIDTTTDPGTDPSPGNEYEDYTTSCNNYFAKYVDISNSLGTLLAMQKTFTDNTALINDSSGVLQTMYTKYNCAGLAANDSKKIICNAILQAQSRIQGNKTQIDDLTQLLNTGIMPAINSRTTLVDELSEYKCDFKIPRT
jgi:hypothetical protein